MKSNFLIFILATLFLVSCDEYDTSVSPPLSYGFEKQNEVFGFVSENNVKSINVYSTTVSNVDRTVLIKVLDGNDDTDVPYTTASSSDYTISSLSVVIPAGQNFGSFDLILNPDLDVTISKYITLEIDPTTIGNFTINNTKNRFKFTFNRLCFSNIINLDLVLDRYGSETSWEIKNNLGITVLSGGPYNDASSNILQPQATLTYTLEDGTYTFTMNDSYGDGMVTSATVTGSYKLSKECGSILVDGAGNGFETSISHAFSLP